MESINLKKKIIRITVSFLIVMLGCTALARTIYELLLPQVTLSSVSEGRIEKKFLSTGQIGRDALAIEKEKVTIKVPKNGRMTKCFIEEGESVTKGQSLFTITLETDKKEEAQTDYDKAELEINLRQTRNELAEKKDKKSRLEQEAAEKRAKLKETEEDYDVIEIDSQIESKIQEMLLNKQLFKEGAVSASTYKQSEKEVQLLQEKKEQLQKDAKEKKEDELTKVEEELESLQLEIEGLEAKEELEVKKMDTMLETETEMTVVSPINGVIYEVDLAEGTEAGQGDAAMIILPSDIAVTLTLNVDQQQADQLQMKQQVNWILNQEKHQAEVVKKTYDSEKNQMIITCALTEADINELALDYKTYKTVEISIESQSEKYDQVVDNSAIVREDNKTYVYTIEQEEKLFEVKYFVYKEPVTVIKEGDTVSAVSGHLSTNQKVIKTMSKPLNNGMEVSKK